MEEFERETNVNSGDTTSISVFLAHLEEVIVEQQSVKSQSEILVDDVQYLHVRNELTERFNGRRLNQTEKALVRDRLQQFIPVSISVFQNFLVRNKALDMEGIFRTAPSGKVFAGALAKCEESNKSGEPPHFLLEKLSTNITIAEQRQQLITTVSSLYKMFLRRIPPLFPESTFEDMMILMPLGQKLRTTYPKLLAQIPPRKTRCMRHILQFLRQVSSQQEKNRMSTNNLARIFAPSLLPNNDKNEPENPTMDFMLKLQREHDWQILCIQILIEDQDDIFDEMDDIIAQRAEENFAENGNICSDTNDYSETIFDTELRGKWYFPAAKVLVNSKKKRRKKERARKSMSKSLRQIGLDFRKVMEQVAVFNASELDAIKHEQETEGGQKNSEASKCTDVEEENVSTFCFEFIQWYGMNRVENQLKHHSKYHIMLVTILRS